MNFAKASKILQTSHTQTSKRALLFTLTPARTQLAPHSLRLIIEESYGITCTSRKLNHAERNYPTHEREMLALVHALKKWKHYLMGSKTLALISADLARFLGLPLHTRKRALLIRIADFSVKECTHFVRAHIRIGSWSARMVFVVFPTGIPLVSGRSSRGSSRAFYGKNANM